MTSQKTSRTKRSSRFVISDDENVNDSFTGDIPIVIKDHGHVRVEARLDMEPVGSKKDSKADKSRELGEFKAVMSKAEKRKQAQLAKAAEERQIKDEERRAAAAAKKAALEEAARKEAEAKEAIREAQRVEEEKKRKEDRDRRKKEIRDAKKQTTRAKRESKPSQIISHEPHPVPPPAVPTAPTVSLFESTPRPQPPRTFPNIPPNPAILRDPAVASIGSVISKPTILPLRVTIGTQTDPVRVLPIEDNHYASLSSSSAAWWLSQQQMEVMQRMSVPPPAPPHWQQTGVPSMADLYWQQQHPAPHRYHRL
jgi:hypothetical protein